MISLVDAALFTYLCNELAEYGIQSSSKFIYDGNIVDEFRTLIPDRVETDQTELNTIAFGDRIPKSLMVFKRGPTVKNQSRMNNVNLKVFTRDTDDTKAYIRDAYLADISYQVSFLTDSSIILDIFEIFFNTKCLNVTTAISVDFKTDKTIMVEGVVYNVSFEPINNVSKISKESGNISQIDFTIKVTGLVFMPYYTEEWFLKDIILGLHVCNREYKVCTHVCDMAYRVREK